MGTGIDECCERVSVSLFKNLLDYGGSRIIFLREFQSECIGFLLSFGPSLWWLESHILPWHHCKAKQCLCMSWDISSAKNAEGNETLKVSSLKLFLQSLRSISSWDHLKQIYEIHGKKHNLRKGEFCFN